MMKLLQFPAIVILVFLRLNAFSQKPGNALKENRLYEKLLETQKEYQAAVAKGDSEEIAEMCYRLGKRYVGVTNYYRAKQWFLKSLQIREPHGPSDAIGKVYVRMLECEGYRGETGSANKVMEYARRAMFNFSKAKTPVGLMNGYRSLACAHNAGLRWKRETLNFVPSMDSAIYYDEKALQLALQIKNPLDIAVSYESISGTWADRGNFDRSIWYEKQALAMYQKENRVYNIFSVYTTLGKAYLDHKQPLLAREWVEKAKLLGDSLKRLNYGQLAIREDVLAQYYEQTGDWKNAYAHEKQYAGLKIEEIETYREGAMEGIVTMYENEKKAIQLKAQQKELVANRKNMKMQIGLICLTALLFLVSGTAGLFFFRLFKKYKKISKENAELVMEQNHRIKNNLQSVTDLLSLQLYRLSDPIAIQALEESLLRVEAMSMVHRRLYGGGSLVEIELKKYLPDLVQSVLRSYHLDYAEVIYELEDVWLHSDNAIPLGLITNELVTNSCKYALPHHPDPVLIIRCRFSDGRLIFHYQDNGPGFIPKADGSSFGLKLIELMTANLNGEARFSTQSGSLFELSFRGHVPFSADDERAVLDKNLN